MTSANPITVWNMIWWSFRIDGLERKNTWIVRSYRAHQKAHFHPKKLGNSLSTWFWSLYAVFHLLNILPSLSVRSHSVQAAPVLPHPARLVLPLVIANTHLLFFTHNEWPLLCVSGTLKHPSTSLFLSSPSPHPFCFWAPLYGPLPTCWALFSAFMQNISHQSLASFWVVNCLSVHF